MSGEVIVPEKSARRRDRTCCKGSKNRYRNLRPYAKCNRYFQKTGAAKGEIVRCECGRYWRAMLDFNGFAYWRVPKWYMALRYPRRIREAK